jgi:hypothetical protein
MLTGSAFSLDSHCLFAVDWPDQYKQIAKLGKQIVIVANTTGPAAVQALVQELQRASGLPFDVAQQVAKLDICQRFYEPGVVQNMDREFLDKVLALRLKGAYKYQTEDLPRRTCGASLTTVRAWFCPYIDLSFFDLKALPNLVKVEKNNCKLVSLPPLDTHIASLGVDVPEAKVQSAKFEHLQRVYSSS